MRDEEEEQQRSRPKIVDKRISAGGHEPRRPDPTPPPAAAAAPRPAEPPDQAPPTDQGGPFGDQAPTPEQRAQAERLAREMVEVPSTDWVLSVAVNLANVAGAKIELGDPQDASLAIDALAGIVSAAGSRLGEAEVPLKQTLAQLQMAFAQRTQAPPG